MYMQEQHDEESQNTPMYMPEYDEEYEDDDEEFENLDEPMAEQVESNVQVPNEADEDENVYFSKTLDNIVAICGPHDEVEL